MAIPAAKDAPVARAARSRDRADIDMAKGFAILCVMLIHSEPLTGTLLHDYVINRAVPIFVTMFGMTSAMWWRSRTALAPRAAVAEWYASRFWRLMIPV